MAIRARIILTVTLAVLATCQPQGYFPNGTPDVQLIVDAHGNHRLMFPEDGRPGIQYLDIRIPYQPKIQPYRLESAAQYQQVVNIQEIRNRLLREHSLNVPYLVEFMTHYGTGHRVMVNGLGRVDESIASFLQLVITGTYGPKCVHVQNNIRSHLSVHLYLVWDMYLTSDLRYSYDELADYMCGCATRYIPKLPDVLSNFVVGCHQPETKFHYVANQQRQLCAVLPATCGPYFQNNNQLINGLLSGVVGETLLFVVTLLDELLSGVDNIVHELVFCLSGNYGGHQFGVLPQVLLGEAHESELNGLLNGGLHQGGPGNLLGLLGVLGGSEGVRSGDVGDSALTTLGKRIPFSIPRDFCLVRGYLPLGVRGQLSKISPGSTIRSSNVLSGILNGGILNSKLKVGKILSGNKILGGGLSGESRGVGVNAGQVVAIGQGGSGSNIQLSSENLQSGILNGGIGNREIEIGDLISKNDILGIPL